MSQTMNDTFNPFGAWAEQSQNFFTSNFNLWNGLFRGLDVYANVWNQYVQLFTNSQQALQNVTQMVLHFYGVPTLEDLNRINRQLYEALNRLDELENRLNEQEKPPTPSIVDGR